MPAPDTSPRTNYDSTIDTCKQPSSNGSNSNQEKPSVLLNGRDSLSHKQNVSGMLWLQVSLASITKPTQSPCQSSLMSKSLNVKDIQDNIKIIVMHLLFQLIIQIKMNGV